MQFCNGIQLNRVLPPGPREYWNELAAEHKKAADHQQWMYAADPFQAAKEVETRQAQAAERRSQAQSSAPNTRADSSPTQGVFAKAPEIRMASSLRDLVEAALKKVGFNGQDECASSDICSR
jgi:ATP-dependent RNA helicase DHX57